MAVNVAYEGIALAEGALVRPSELGLFLPLPAPMPVGSRLVLERGAEGRQKVRVTRVREGAEPGVYIVAEGAIVFPLVEEAPSAPHVVEPEVTIPSPPPPAAVTAAAVEVTAPRVPSAPHVVVAENTVPEVMEMDADEPTTVVETAAPAAASTAPAEVSVPIVEAAADGDSDGDEDDTVVTVTNGAERPDANGERGAKKGRRGKRGGGKR